MKIDKVAGGHIPQTTFQQKSTQAPQSAQTVKVPENTIQTNTKAIDRAQDEMAMLPDVDMAKVEAIRTALARGELSLDTNILSKTIMQFHTGHE